jgi:transcriptional regulator with XRE-family HTH domain
MRAGTIVARNIRRLRTARGLSQEALAGDAGLHATYVNRLENERQSATVPVLENLSRALACDIRELFDPSKVAKPVKPLRGGRRKQSK